MATTLQYSTEDRTNFYGIDDLLFNIKSDINFIEYDLVDDKQITIIADTDFTDEETFEVNKLVSEYGVLTVVTSKDIIEADGIDEILITVANHTEFDYIITDETDGSTVASGSVTSVDLPIVFTTIESDIRYLIKVTVESSVGVRVIDSVAP